MTNLTGVVHHLKAERDRAAKEVQRLDTALAALNGNVQRKQTATRRKMSAAGRARIVAAQKARWAKVRGESKPAAPATTKAAKPKRRISPEGLKRIIAATKKRWKLEQVAAKRKAA